MVSYESDNAHIDDAMHAQQKSKIAIILTALNEEKNIADVLQAIDSQYDVFVVDDCSHDQTVAIARRNGSRVIRLPIHLGQGFAALTGYKVLIHEQYDIVVKMDADGQHNPAEISLLVEKLQSSNIDIVVGSRILGSNHENAPFFRRTFLPLYTWIINQLTGYRMTDAMSGFRAFRLDSLGRISSVLDEIIEPQFMAAEMFIRFSKAGLSVDEVPIVMRNRATGVSYKGFIRYGLGVFIAIARTLLDKTYRTTKRRTAPPPTGDAP